MGLMKLKSLRRLGGDGEAEGAHGSSMNELCVTELQDRRDQLTRTADNRIESKKIKYSLDCKDWVLLVEL